MTTRHINDKLKLKTAFVNPSTATDTTVVTAIAGKMIIVHSVVVVSSGTNNVYFKSGSTAITATNALAANGGFVLSPSQEGWFFTLVGEALIFTTSAAVGIGCTITYSEE